MSFVPAILGRISNLRVTRTAQQDSPGIAKLDDSRPFRSVLPLLLQTMHVRGTLLALFLLVSATVNIIIVLGTVCKITVFSHLKSYTWINKDYPLEMPVGDIPTVEMTFQESARFILSDSSGKPNWDTLITNQFGIGFQHLGPYHYRYISGAYHSLHCLYSMQEDFDKLNHLEQPSHHLIHCLMYFRQIFLCNADLTLEEGDFMAKNLTTDRIGGTRKCRDWTTVADWVSQNNREWLEYNGVSLEEVSNM